MSHRSRLPSDVRMNAPLRVPTSTRTPLTGVPFRPGADPSRHRGHALGHPTGVGVDSPATVSHGRGHRRYDSPPTKSRYGIRGNEDGGSEDAEEPGHGCDRAPAPDLPVFWTCRCSGPAGVPDLR